MKDTTIFVRIENWGAIQLDYLIEEIRKLKAVGTWNLTKWKPSPALIEKNGKWQEPYLGQTYDPTLVDLVAEGWDHDHCAVCTKTISNRENPDWVTGGYTHSSGISNSWICEECYNLFMLTDNIEKELEKYPKEER